MTSRSDQPAFPTGLITDGKGIVYGGSNGMTLRDYFAGQALAGGLEQGVEDDMNVNWWHDSNKIAKRAYAIADAMLAARDKP